MTKDYIITPDEPEADLSRRIAASGKAPRRTAGHAVCAIPGQATRYTPPPDGAAEAALTRIADLNAALAQEHYDGFLAPPPVVAHYWPPGHILTTRIYPAWDDYLPLTDPVQIDWRWGEVWRTADWYETGWHPDVQFDHRRLRTQSRHWGRLVWQTLNPGKSNPTRYQYP